MADIKTRNVVEGSIKTIDKSATAAERMKSAYIQTKDRAEQSYYSDENSPNEYATDKVSKAEHHIVEEGTYQFNKQGQKVREKIRTRKEEKIADEIHRSEDTPRDQIRRSSQNAAKNQTRATQQTTNKSIKTTHQAEKKIKLTARSSGEAVKSTAKGNVKTARKSVKTAEKTAKTTIKIAQKTVKVAAKATVSAVKAIVAGTKALIAAISAGGWVAVVVIISICLIAMIAGSCFGIFFSNEDTGGQTMSSVVTEINTEYTDALNAEKAAHTYDVLEMSGCRADWKDVLAVYAVKTATNSDNPQEVATMTDEKKELLKNIFWEMNEISARTESRKATEIIETDDGNGNIVEEEVTVTRTYLYITASHKTANEMADKYNFNDDQRDQFAALLDDENNALWTGVLYGITSSDKEIVAVALSQLDNVGGQPYWF